MQSDAPPKRRVLAASRSRHVDRFGLYAIVALGAALRLFPVWFGLPYLGARPDEETAIGHAVAVLGGDPDPHFFHWPSLTFYAFAGLYAAASLMRRVLFFDPALSSVEHVVIARTFVALAGTLTIVVLYRLARRTADEATGLLAALFLAVATLHVRDSHFAMTDVLMTLLTTTSVALLLRALDRGMGLQVDRTPVRGFAAAGLAGGLAASTKYSAAVIIASLAAVQLLWLVRIRSSRWRAQAWTPSIVFLPAFACGFIVGTPYALVELRAFAAAIRFDFTHLSEGHVVNLGRGWSYHLERSLPYGAGIPIFLAAIAGVVPMVRHYGRHALVAGAFAAALYASVGGGYAVFFRYVLPLLPIVCLSAAVAVRHTGAWLASHTGLPGPASVGLLAALVAAPALVNSAWLDLLLAKRDTRVVAGRWLATRLAPEESVHEAGGVYAQIDLSRARFHRWTLFDPASSSFGDPNGRTPDWLVFEESPLWTYAAVPPELRRLAADKYALVYMVRATKGRASARMPSAVYDLQDAFFLPLSGFSTIERPGPTVLIYRRRDAPPISSR